MTFHRVWRVLAAIFALALATGCAHVVNVVPSQASIAPAEKINADVALVLSDELKRYQHSESRMGDTWNYPNMGQASAEHFRNGLESRFRKVTVLSARPTGPAASPYAIVVEPRIVNFTFDIPLTKFQVYPATIRYGLAAYSSNGQEVYRRETSGVGDRRAARVSTLPRIHLDPQAKRSKKVCACRSTSFWLLQRSAGS
jgi:hypothetical protein